MTMLSAINEKLYFSLILPYSSAVSRLPLSEYMDLCGFYRSIFVYACKPFILDLLKKKSDMVCGDGD